MARAGLGWTVHELAEKSNVRPATISSFERGGDSKLSTVDAIKKVFLDTGLVTFTGDDCVCVKDASIDCLPATNPMQSTD